MISRCCFRAISMTTAPQRFKPGLEIKCKECFGVWKTVFDGSGWTLDRIEYDLLVELERLTKLYPDKHLMRVITEVCENSFPGYLSNQVLASRIRAYCDSHPSSDSPKKKHHMCVHGVLESVTCERCIR